MKKSTHRKLKCTQCDIVRQNVSNAVKPKTFVCRFCQLENRKKQIINLYDAGYTKVNEIFRAMTNKSRKNPGSIAVLISKTLKESGREVKAGHRPKDDLIYHLFDEIDTEEKAYWLGFITADGCVVDRKNKPYRLQLGLKRSDEKHLLKFAEIFKKTPRRIVHYNKATGTTTFASEIEIHSIILLLHL